MVKASVELGVYSFGEFMAKVKSQLGESAEQQEAFQAAWDEEKAASRDKVKRVETS